MSKIQEAAIEAEQEIAELDEEKDSESHIKSSTEAESEDTEGKVSKEAVAEGEPEKEPEAPVFDPLTYIDSLKDKNLTAEQKKALKDGYLRQADYTKKTQEIAEARKMADEYRKYQPILQKVLSDQKLLETVLGIEGQNDAEKSPYPEDPLEYAKWVKSQVIEEMQQLNAQNADFQNAMNLDKRLQGTTDEDVKFQKLVLGIVAQDEDYKQGRKTATQATQDALAWYADWQKGYTTKVQQDLTNRAKNRSFVTQRTSSPNAVEANAPKNIREAFRQAQEELGMK
jgi:hypothetical protein